ncbi:Rha family transcriptional regulator [Xenorhabdus stockiae]|uniref:Rha family transcriptional regulator n=1 Tax=Xenorhabdus stockiae TaxID=351614 RepID=A0A2D0K479_9GAMM|nr:Rha family transcriptional regulator [Xenorhabdus stockiae]PHM56856.1 Rha family transcriptional regulator [Xenorhabdus stockiae]
MQLITTKKTNLPVTEAPTMTSLEMVDYINADRKAKAEAEGFSFPCKKYRKLQHKDFLKKVPKVLGEEHSAKFFAQYKDGTGRELPCYRFPKRESCLMAMSYNYELQAQVFDHMTELEAKSGFGFTIQQLQDMLVLARKASDEDSSDAGRRLRKRQDDLATLNKVGKLISDLGQIAIELVGGGKEAIAHEK